MCVLYFRFPRSMASRVGIEYYKNGKLSFDFCRVSVKYELEEGRI